MNYRTYPVIPINGKEKIYQSWQEICFLWRQHGVILPGHVLVIETYPGTDEEEICRALCEFLPELQIIRSDTALLPRDTIEASIAANLTDDRVFGRMDHRRLEEFFDESKAEALRHAILENTADPTAVIGTGASLITKGDLLVYADLTRWEIQLRWRNGASNWQADNGGEDQLRKYKRGFFIEWRVADRRKREIFHDVDFWLDTNRPKDPAMITGEAFHNAMEESSSKPFSMVPYFDPGVWGGHWMQQQFGLDASRTNFAWSFNGVPEENSLCLSFADRTIEFPAIDLVFAKPKALLGDKVYARFGAEFPIRFDFLDTMGGQNLSLQVHPLTEYIQDRFGMHYTQDESYYMLDAGEDAVVYLGVKENICPQDMLDDLKKAQEEGIPFPDGKYINQIPVKKHDHVLIPAGTIHCSGKNTMVLEISATPYIFTFKLWDWGRVGLDGRPRPVHLEHGSRNIQWDRDTAFVQRELVNAVYETARGDGYREEHTGLHELEFIETRRLWFTKSVDLNTGGGVQMAMVVDGKGCRIESRTDAFPSFTANYAECFIIPAAVGEFSVTPLQESEETCLLRAYVRT